MDDIGLLIKRVRAIDETTPDAEDTLMDGYASALALEAERVRLERRLAELEQALAGDHDSARLRELSTLKQRIASTEGELALLREALTIVRERLVAAGIGTAAESAAH